MANVDPAVGNVPVVREQPRKVLVKPPPPIELGSNNRDTWEAWEDDFQWYSEAVELDQQPGRVQVAVLMSALGSAVRDIFKNFNLSDEEKHNLNIVKKKFREYFAPSESEVYESFRFNNMTQDADESIDEFVTKITTQAGKCNFSSGAKDRLVRDRLVHGLKSQQMREEVLRKKNLTLEEAITICKSCEEAAKHSKVMATDTPEKNEVFEVKKMNTGTRQKKEAKVFDCTRCGKKHQARKCPAYGSECFNCGIKGHFAEKCKNSKKRGKKLDEGNAYSESESDSEKVEELRVHSVNCNDKDLWNCQVSVHNKKFTVNIDTGAQCNVVTQKILQKIGGGEIVPTRVKRLIAYNGGRIKVLGKVLLRCTIRKKQFPLWFNVISGDRNCVIDGRSAMKAGLIARLHNINVSDEMFIGLGELKNFVYDAELVENPKFIVHAARSIPYAMKAAVKKELDEMEDLGVIEPCKDASDAVSPMVVVKRKGKYRICADLTDVNPNIKRRHYPLTGIDQVAARVAGSQRFTILDCKKGFWQINLSPRTSKLCTFATPWGRYSYKRLPFGLVSAPELFQRIMSELFDDLEGVEVSMDDILIHAPTEEKLKNLTEKVISILRSKGLKLNKEKCIFNQPSVMFLGHTVSGEGLRADETKLEAIDKLQRPVDKKSLQRFLGMINYVGKFIPNLSDKTAALRELLKRGTEWQWTPHQESAFINLKSCLKNTPVLAFYDVNKPVKVSVDSSSLAFGGVLLQEGRPIAYATKALTETEQRWPQIEKEAGAIRFALRKFHDYLWGKEILVETDHKPLETIFMKPLTKAPPRLKKILYEVKAYDVKVQYVKGTAIPVADTLSRDCKAESADDSEPEDEFDVHSITCLTEEAAERYKIATASDPALPVLIKYISIGWPDRIDQVPKVIRSCHTFRDELSYIEGLVFKGDRVFVPESERNRVLRDIHRGHFGIQSSLRRAREFLFWPGMTSDITQKIEQCSVCEKHQKANQKECVSMKRVPELPFEMVATDLFTYRKREYILLVDSFSGYFDFQRLTNTTSSSVIEFLKRKFSEHGIPLEVHSDGGPQYSSEKFKKFARDWNFEHHQSSPYFARSNGLAERYVQTAKRLLKKCSEDNQDIQMALLLSRNTPGVELRSPAERLFSRRTRNPLCVNKNLLMPRIAKNTSECVLEAREKQKSYADKGARSYEQLEIGDRVRVQERDKTWSTGVVSKHVSDRSYNVDMDDGRNIWRNRHFLHTTNAEHPIVSPSLPRSIPPMESPADNVPKPRNDISHDTLHQATSTEGSDSPAPRPETPQLTSTLQQPGTLQNSSFYQTRSGRIVRAPDKLNL